MANPNSLPLHEKILLKNTIQRTVDLTILLLLLSLIVYRFTTLTTLNNHGMTWLVALACESWFTFIWVLVVSTRWNSIEYKTYPEHLLKRVHDHDLPPVDMFVTTADPVFEPPIITVNTVLSLLAVDYPANKLACYVSDDGCSPLTFYSLTEALKFAKLWVPFCKKYGVHVRTPFRYFSGEPPEYSNEYSLEFQQEWKKMKEEYDQLSQKIDAAVQNSAPCELTASEFAVFSNIERNNHPTIIKVIWENKEGLSQGLPHLVYVSREKHPKKPHHYKAGAMNVLTRVSGVMTNAPFLLNVDCDMFANNPQIVLHAMCLLLGEKKSEHAFVQFPQFVKDMAGIQGPLYAGSGCFHRRKIIYGLSTDVTEIKGKLNEQGLEQIFGKSVDLTKSATRILSGSNNITDCLHDLSCSVKAAYLVAGCGYEGGSSWGTQIQEPAIFIPVALFLMYNLYTLSEYLQAGLSIRAWWNNQRMDRLKTMNAWLFGVLSVILKLLGLSEMVFEVTRKEQTSNGDGASIEAGRFTFDESPIFIPGTTVLLVHLNALVISLLGFKLPNHGGDAGPGVGEILCCVWVVLMFSPFVKGLFGRGKYGIPSATIWKSVALAMLLLLVCVRTSMD